MVHFFIADEPEVKRVEQVHLESWSGRREVWIRCMVDAEPQAEVTWLLDGKVTVLPSYFARFGTAMHIQVVLRLRATTSHCRFSKQC